MRQEVRWNTKISIALFLLKKIFLCVIRGLRAVFECDEKCDEKKFCCRIIAFYICIVFFEILIYNYKRIRATRTYAGTFIYKTIKRQ